MSPAPASRSSHIGNAGTGVNLVDRLYSELAGDGLARLASRLGEAPGRVQMAIGVVVPALVAVLASKSATPHGRSDIFELIQRSGFDGRGLRAPSRLPTGASAMIDLAARGLPLVGALFGTRKGSVADWLAASACIGIRSSSALLMLAVPRALDVLAHEARQRGGLTPSVLGHLLSEQWACLCNATPDGLASALGCTDLSELRSNPRTVAAQADKPSRSVWRQWAESRRRAMPW